MLVFKEPIFVNHPLEIIESINISEKIHYENQNSIKKLKLNNFLSILIKFFK